MAKQRVDKEPETIAESKFTKAQLVNSKKYANRRDLLTAMLKDGESYSHSEADKLIEDFMKGKVN
ncbi:MAG: hypothetical protein AB7E42_05110 [Anaerotignaceae bacterium]